ncbi:LysR family transcriptional regulator [Oceaniovalibus sp. ACAM 378]|uniref:LysR family transcriptional regulator n=1 Tax=Oceaniovalibus sp. ACAM 378 TaxID=2599923 RepID=UPI0011DA0827|nr:LysR family transcriptional regulator [Oceaniovalibus sp. ACAM 378]TYB84002.1 LysR family transcriptional regulator [Oceaniovalibus sp. ACAM 378]
MLDWNDIRIFLAVAREGSTLAASRKLNINQTTVGRRMHALETALGLTLFERDTRGYAMTAQGSALFDVAAGMENAADQVLTRASHLRRTSDGTIRVTAAHSSMTHWVLPLISEFRKHNPNTHFETNASEQYVSLEGGEADIAIRASDNIAGDTLIVRRLPPVRWGIYCSKAYLAANGMPHSIDDLIHHPVLSYPDAMVESVKLLKWLDQHLDRSKIVNTIDSVTTMSASLRTEEAIGVLPCVEGDPLPDLVMCFTTDDLTSGLWLVASREAYQEPRVRKFMKFLGEYFPRDGRAATF